MKFSFLHSKISSFAFVDHSIYFVENNTQLSVSTYFNNQKAWVRTLLARNRLEICNVAGEAFLPPFSYLTIVTESSPDTPFSPIPSFLKRTDKLVTVFPCLRFIRTFNCPSLARKHDTFRPHPPFTPRIPLWNEAPVQNHASRESLTLLPAYIVHEEYSAAILGEKWNEIAG